jgi:hypothetical protein
MGQLHSKTPKCRHHRSHHNVIQLTKATTCIGFGEQVDSWEKRGVEDVSHYQRLAGINFPRLISWLAFAAALPRDKNPGRVAQWQSV